MNDPYRPPRSELRDTAAPVDFRFRWKAVALGTVADIGGTIVVATAIFAMLLSHSGADNAEELSKTLNSDPSYLLILLVVGLGFTSLGGYVAGRIARHTQLKHALVTGLCSLLLGALLGQSTPGPYEGILNLFGYGFHFPMVLLGGWIAKRRAESELPDKT
jgi:hypothetical protein